MKILAVSGSPRKKGNTEIMLNEALEGAQAEGAEVELYRLSGKNIQPCDGCWSCMKEGVCHIKDDMQELYPKLLAADGIIIGTPIYYYAMTAQTKTFIDRSMPLGHPKRNLANKIGGVVVVGGSLGLVDALKDIYFYFVTQRIIPANYIAAYGGAKGDVNKLQKGRQAARDLGRQMVRLAQQGFEYPPEFMSPMFAYGTHTF
jgi:multimeric flavodoxin WrbA